MRQDWVTEFLQDLSSMNWAYFAFMPSFELALILQDCSFEKFGPF
jgi:hypothetical protein